MNIALLYVVRYGAEFKFSWHNSIKLNEFRTVYTEHTEKDVKISLTRSLFSPLSLSLSFSHKKYVDRHFYKETALSWSFYYAASGKGKFNWSNVSSFCFIHLRQFFFRPLYLCSLILIENLQFMCFIALYFVNLCNSVVKMMFLLLFMTQLTTHALPSVAAA